MFCKHCGKEIQEECRFCLNCGAPVEGTGAVYSPQTQVQTATSLTPARKTLPKQKKILYSVLCVAIAVVLIVFSVVIANLTATRELRNAIASRNGATVNMVYAQARTNKSTLKKYDALIGKTISEMVSELNAYDFTDAAEKIGGDAVEQYMATAWGTLWTQSSESDISDSISLNNQIHWQELGELIESKENYCEGLYCYKTEKDYDEAIEFFAEVSDADSQYDAAVTMISECTDLYVQSILKEADEYFAEGNIEEALFTLQNTRELLEKSISAELTDKIYATIASYAETYMQKAEEYLKAGDFTAAVGHVEAAIAINPNGGYESMLEEYKKYLPFKLYLSENILSAEGLYKSGSEAAIDRKNYDNCILYSWWKNATPKSATYYLGGNYDTVDGVFFTTAKSASYQFDGYAYIEAYGDGKLLYTSPSMNCESLPETISFSVTGVQKLEIRFVGKDSTAEYIYCPEVAVSELTAHKNPPQ